MGYFNTVIASFKDNSISFGTLHPNATGYRRIYRDAVVHQLEQSIALCTMKSRSSANGQSFELH